jgi:hypothetical protein
MDVCISPQTHVRSPRFKLYVQQFKIKVSSAVFFTVYPGIKESHLILRDRFTSNGTSFLKTLLHT